MTRIVLIDDHKLVRGGFKALLSAQPGLSVVAEAGTAREGFEAVERTRCDLVILDFNLPDADGPSLVTLIRRHYPKLPVLLLSQHTEPDKVRYAMDCGCHGYVVKSAEEEDLLTAIRIVAVGGIYVHPSVAEACLGRRETALEFTPRDVAILRMLASGVSNQELSERLHVSLGTIKRDLSQLFARLDVSDRTQLLAAAISRGLIEPS